MDCALLQWQQGRKNTRKSTAVRGDVADAARMGNVGGVHVPTGMFLANPAGQERRGIATTVALLLLPQP